MNEEQLKVFELLCSRFVVNKRITYMHKEMVDNKVVSSIRKAEEDSYIVHINDDFEFDVDFYEETEVSFTYFFFEDEDYSQTYLKNSEVDNDYLDQLISYITTEQ